MVFLITSYFFSLKKLSNPGPKRIFPFFPSSSSLVMGGWKCEQIDRNGLDVLKEKMMTGHENR